jgi:RNA polymerase sigma factor (TIGR02999 family)
VNTLDSSVSELMGRLRQGDHQATRQLFDLLYPELRRLAAVRMSRERSDHTWQPTVLVNELYLELIKIKSLKGGESPEKEKEAFFRLAAFLMRRLLIHHSRPLYRSAQKVELDDTDFTGQPGDNETLADIEIALSRLSEINPSLRTVVELRVFEGRTAAEIATELGCSVKTVNRHWAFAQRWLHQALGGG